MLIYVLYETTPLHASLRHTTGVQGYLTHEKQPPPLGPPPGPRNFPPVGPEGATVSYGRGNPVALSIPLSLAVTDTVPKPGHLCGIR